MRSSRNWSASFAVWAGSHNARFSRMREAVSSIVFTQCRIVKSISLASSLSLAGATILRRRISAVRPMIGSVMTMTWLTMFQGSHLNLKKNHPDKDRLDSKKQNFHYLVLSVVAADLSRRFASSSARRALSFAISRVSSSPSSCFGFWSWPWLSSTSVP
jgi:hypothetical protein